jgi:hypothetical protein
MPVVGYFSFLLQDNRPFAPKRYTKSALLYIKAFSYYKN